MEFDELKVIYDRILEKCKTTDLFYVLFEDVEFNELGYTDKYRLLDSLTYDYAPTIDSLPNTPEFVSESIKYLFKYRANCYLSGKREDTIIELKDIVGKHNKINFLNRKKADHIHNGYPIEGKDYQSDIFHDYLKTEIEYWENFIEPETMVEPETNKPDKRETSTNQQILILEYLGIRFEKISITAQNKGVLFGYLLNKNSKNTEDSIRYLAKRSEKDLKRVFEIFQDCNYRDLSIQVENDLKTLQAKKIKPNQEKK